MTNDRGRKRRLFEFLLVALLVLLALTGLVLDQASRPQAKPLTHAGQNWSRVSYGMDKAEVVAILGQPARTLNAGETGDGLRFDARELLVWLGDQEPLEILIGDKNEVVWKTEFPLRPTLVQEPNLFERVVGYWFTRE